MNNADLDRLLALARTRTMSPAERARQVRSFAWGNAHFENPDVTREMIEQAFARLTPDSAK